MESFVFCLLIVVTLGTIWETKATIGATLLIVLAWGAFVFWYMPPQVVAQIGAWAVIFKGVCQ
jgi:hypothetical protein